MKLSISNIAWNQHEDKEVYNLMNRYGFYGLEIAPTRFFSNPYYQDDKTINTLAENIKNHGLTVTSMQSLHFGKDKIKLFGTEEERDELLNYTKDAIEFASKLGVNNLVFGSPKLRVINDEQKEYGLAIKFFSELAMYAQEKKVILSIEPNPKEYGTNFINTTDEALKLVGMVNNDNFKINLDLSTIILNNEDIDIIKKCGKYINHVHISEPFLDILVENRFDFHKNVKEELEKIGYKNWVSIEMGKKSDIDNRENIENALKYISSIFGGEENK
ncbi:MAG: sugar phosphate isomerase/epimerase family protein [Lachnospirales bacterium]